MRDQAANTAQSDRPGRARRRGRVLAGGASVAVHGAALFAFLLAHGAPRSPEPSSAVVQLVAAPPAPPAERELETAAAASAAKPAPAPRPPALAKPRPVLREVASLTASPTAGAASTGNDGAVGEGELVGAARAGSGAAGACDMIGRLEAALRKDAMVRTALAARGAAGGALRVWDGDWTASPGQEGRGLAAVREAVMWEVGFAPAACRAEPMRGLVLVTLADTPGAPRLVLGADRWRWSDMLTPRRYPGRGG